MRLGKLIHTWRVFHEKTLAFTAAEIGVTRHELSRLETGRPISSTALTAVLGWILSPDKQKKVK